jgi:hypothetical protein
MLWTVLEAQTAQCQVKVRVPEPPAPNLCTGQFEELDMEQHTELVHHSACVLTWLM